MLQGRIPVLFLGAAASFVCSCVFAQTEGESISLALVPDDEIVAAQAAPELQSAESLVAPEPELVRQRFPDGKILVERWVVEQESGDIVNHGEFVRYNQAGDVVLSGLYEMGEMTGEWYKLLTVEQVKELSGPNVAGFAAPFISRARFEAGEMTGEWICKDARGGLVFSWSFSKGKRNGPSTWYNSAGQLLQQLHYADNRADGPARVAIKADQQAKEVVFEGGRMLRRVDRPFADQSTGGKIKSQEWYLVPTPYNIEFNDWVGNKVIYQPFDSSQVVRHGRSINYYENGQRESEGHYVNGKRHGTFVWWHPNGQQMTLGEYQDDHEEGTWVWWHENGMKEARGSYVLGKKVNEWSVWSAEGKLVKRTNIDDASMDQRLAQPIELESTVR